MFKGKEHTGHKSVNTVMFLIIKKETYVLSACLL